MWKGNSRSTDPINADNEFRPLLEDALDDLDCKFIFAPAGEHVPTAEQNNRTIADHVRVAVHYLPYKRIPKLLVHYLAMDETNKLNWYPAKGGISPYFSPNMILQ